ncbi:MAG TPA: GGDEF domain-containing protein, partial [Myxococcota bacterium]|nr:GGDEF domain-containing protein [Myxococcota bacterium]
FRQVWGQRRTARELQRSALYPLVGFLLAQGAPLGMLVTRAWEQGAWPTATWLLGELAADRLAYVYLVLSTTTVFVSLGLLLGSQEDRLRRLAVTDPLTGLLNRRYFSARLHQELARAKRYETPLSLLIVDLDWLKAINDGSGHDAGDMAIRAVATTLEHSLRATDIAARYAGDEFAALLPQTSASEAMGLARRISAQVRELGLGPEGGPLSVSIGVADLEGSGGSSAEELFTAADEALYAAKAAGRNSVMAASSVTLSVFAALEHRA